eukprot:2775419-Amphidinium_carterae.1
MAQDTLLKRTQMGGIVCGRGGGGRPQRDLALPSYVGYLRQPGPRAGHDLPWRLQRNLPSCIVGNSTCYCSLPVPCRSPSDPASSGLLLDGCAGG